MPRRAKADIEPVEALETRAAKRRRMGTLRASRVEAATAARYYMHVYWFHAWCALQGYAVLDSWEQLDATCGDYLGFLWDANQNLSLAADTLSGLQHLLEKRHGLQNSWALLTVWRNKEPPCRAPPMSEKVALAIAAHWAFIQQLPGPAIGVSLAFYGFLRIGEVFKLVVADIIFAGDMKSIIVNLGQTKGGKEKASVSS